LDTPPILRDFPHGFDTARLTIRRPEPGDGAETNAAIRETWSDLAEWMPWALRRPTVEESEEFVRKAHVKFVEREDLLFLLFLKGTRTLVGGSGLHRIDWKVPSFEIGYWCRERFQREGYITEAAAGIADFAVRELGARRLVISCDAENERSAAIPRRIGFVHEATLTNHKRHHVSGELRDTLVFARVVTEPRRSSRR
jgi:RimJ/RimL family protein N-acetyltransferase